MPYAYKCQVKESPVHGKGLFACEDIPKGAVYWAWELPNPKPLVGYEEKPNRVFTREQLEKMENKEELTEILHKGFYYADLDVYIDLNDGTQYNNHSDDWNSQIIYDQGKDLKKLTCIVRKEVKAGDQLTAYYGNYMSNQAQWVKDLTLKYNPKRMDLENHVEQTGNKAKNWKIE